MNQQYKIVYQGGTGEIIEKKSRFIAATAPVGTEEEAIQFIEQVKKKHWNAAHNCSAFVVGENNQIQRCSDDGEPGGTAGKPMLEVLMGEEIHNTVVVVTRYFGGTLLGTGGLVRAYSKAVQEGLKNSVVVEKCQGIKHKIITDYQGIGKIQYLLGQQGLTIMDSDYGEDVRINVLVPADCIEKLCKEITEVTNGQARQIQEEAVWFAKLAGEIILFPQTL